MTPYFCVDHSVTYLIFSRILFFFFWSTSWFQNILCVNWDIGYIRMNNAAPALESSEEDRLSEPSSRVSYNEGFHRGRIKALKPPRRTFFISAHQRWYLRRGSLDSWLGEKLSRWTKFRAVRESQKAATCPHFPFYTFAKTNAESFKPLPPASKGWNLTFKRKIK